MGNEWRAEANRNYLARSLAAVAILQQERGDTRALSGEEIKRVLNSWSMQATVAHLAMKTGGRLDNEFVKPFEDELRIRMSFATAILKKPRTTKLHIRKSPAIYASASTPDLSEYTVTIDTGTIIALMLGALALVKHNCTIGFKITPERQGHTAYKNLETMWRSLVAAYRLSPLAHLLPDEASQTVLAHSIVARSLDWILLHEVGHVIRGHLDFCARWASQPTITETSREFERIPPNISRCLEGQADDHATLAIAAKWRHLTSTNNFDEYPLISGTCGYPFFNATDVCQSIAYSIGLAFHLLSYGSTSAFDAAAARSDVVDWKNAKYPPLEYRVWRALRLSHLLEPSGLSWRQVLNDVRESLVQAGLVTLNQLVPENKSEDQLQEYNRLLAVEGTQVFEAEKAWLGEGIDIRQPPPKLPKRVWLWKFPRR